MVRWGEPENVPNAEGYLDVSVRFYGPGDDDFVYAFAPLEATTSDVIDLTRIGEVDRAVQSVPRAGTPSVAGTMTRIQQ